MCHHDFLFYLFNNAKVRNFFELTKCFLSFFQEIFKKVTEVCFYVCLIQYLRWATLHLSIPPHTLRQLLDFVELHSFCLWYSILIQDVFTISVENWSLYLFRGQCNHSIVFCNSIEFFLSTHFAFTFLINYFVSVSQCKETKSF